MSQGRSYTPSRDQYTVGWICPVVIELTAALALLDNSMLSEEDKTFRVPGDDTIYNVGKIGQHYVVVVVCPRMGTSSATAMVTNMRRSFPCIKHVLVVGIAGGVPCYGTESREQIVLGDVVVGVPQMNQGGVKHYEGGAWLDENVHEDGGHLLHPSPALLQAVNILRARHSRMPGTQIPSILKQLRENLMLRVRSDFQDPGNEEDRLFEDNYPHKGTRYNDCKGTCDLMYSKLRDKRGDRALRELDTPEIHYGTIGCADSFIASAAKRNELYKRHNVICFEMEAAGIMSENLGLIIRGISDYADSHHNKAWQGYAAMTAAAYAKELLLVLNHDAPKELQAQRMESWEMMHPRRQQEVYSMSESSGSEDLRAGQMSLGQGSDQLLQLRGETELCGIEELNSPKQPLLDLVFVHGLAGNRETAWTNADSKFFWPKTLAKQISTVRVMCFGWTTNEPLDQGILQATALLEMHLSSKRSSHPTRPLIFVCQGVGGLLCQLMLSKHAFLLSTSVLLFFGSCIDDIALKMPFTEQEIFSWQQLCENTEEGFQQNLRQPKTIKILKCYPTEEILSYREAIHAVANNHLIVETHRIRSSHSNITRFLEPNDPGYQLVLRTVRAQLFLEWAL